MGLTSPWSRCLPRPETRPNVQILDCQSMATTSSFSASCDIRPLEHQSNAELLKFFLEWLEAQRYGRTTREGYGLVAKRFCLFLGSQSVKSVTLLDVRRYVIEVMKIDSSNVGANRHLWALRRFFDFLYLAGLVDCVAPPLCAWPSADPSSKQVKGRLPLS
jgi:hypothetical protein